MTAEPGYVWAGEGRDERLVPADQAHVPPECNELHPLYGYDRRQCIKCMLRQEYVRREVQAQLDEVAEADEYSMRVSGDALLDLDPVAPIWGDAFAPVTAEGQALMIVGPDGTGKTSTAGQYGRARLGLADEMWDMPVRPLPPDRSVYYLAADRPRQAMEALMRGFSEAHRDLLRDRLHIHKGPPPYRLSATRGQEWLLGEVEETGAGLLIFDSRKDFGATTNADEVAGFSTAVQLLLASEVEVVVLHHPNERRRNGPPDLTAISGHGGVYHGMGSILFLEGSTGGTVVDVHHIKPVRELLPRFQIEHDHKAGVSERVVGLVAQPDGTVEGGRVPVSSVERDVLACIDAHPSGCAPAASLKEVLRSDNLSRDLAPLVKAGLIEHNGLRGPQSGYRRPATSDT
ncbi:AAA domain-containing protein [Pedococcus dokdonensis]|uniref:AAA domain-containing protein n=1 Tax=Pedococcus dokdonensis TaxID=443156 RepID=A0A1H0LWU6_9MICO|nr:AAA family ATPase [Pedococcus dokdonensis]SDO72615.1 AAA domain-containing protein [Pedococcus dokdonensis]